MKSASLWVVWGSCVRFLAIQFEPVIVQTLQFIYPQKFPVILPNSSTLPNLFGLSVFQLDRRLYFQCSRHVGFSCRCESVSHLLPGWSVSVRNVHPVLTCRMFGFRFLQPYLLHHYDHHHRLRCLNRSTSGSERSSVYHWGCRAVSHPIGRIFCPVFSGKVGFLVWFHRLLVPYLIGFFSRSETLVSIEIFDLPFCHVGFFPFFVQK